MATARSMRWAVGAALAAALAMSAPSADARELVYSSILSGKHPTNAVAVATFGDAISKATGGSLTIKLFPGGTLASGTATPAAIKNGTIDMGLMADMYTPTVLPTSTMVSDLAVIGEDSRIMTGAVDENLLIDCEECREDYREYKILPLASYSLTPYYFMCAKDKIVKAEDVKGKRVRATGAMGQLVAGLGGTAVNITSAEIYEAMQRGQVDCALGSVPWLKTYTLWELVKYVTAAPVGTYHGTNFLNIRTETWKKLSAKEKQAMIDNLAHATRLIVETYQDDDVTVAKTARDKGIQFIDAAASLDDTIKAYRSKDIQRVTELGKTRGVKNADRIVQNFIKLVTKWKGIVEEIGKGPWGPQEWDKYEQALDREIFKKAKFM